MINNQNRFTSSFCRRRRRRYWLNATSKESVETGYPKYIFTSWSYFIRLYASFDGLWWVFVLPKLLLYLGKIGLIGLELNSERKIFSFICCAKQRTILLDAPRAWRVLYDHPLYLNFGNVFHIYRQGLSSGVKSCCKALLKWNHQSVSITSGVEFSFNDYNLRSFCKHLRSMQHFFSDSRILSLPI